MMKNNTSGASLFLLWTCGASLRISVLAVPPVISIIQQDLHLSGTEIGLLFGVPVILFAIAATPGSTLITRFGVRSTLLTALRSRPLGGAAGRNFERLASLAALLSCPRNRRS